MAAVAGADLVGQRLDALQQPQFLQVRDNRLARFQRRHAGVLAAVNRLTVGVLRGVLRAGHVAIISEHAHDGQVMALTDFVVVRVMRGGDFHHACALFHVGVFVADNRNFAVRQRQHHMAAVQVGIARVSGVNRHGGVAEHGFGAGGCQFQHLARLLHRVQQMPEVSFLLLIFHFRVRNRALAARAPVDQPVAAVNQPLFVQADEHLTHCLGAALVHREALAAPVAADAHAALLGDDASAVLFLPLPRAVEEALSAEGLLGQPLFAHRIDDFHFRRDGGVIRAGQPERRIALHAVIADGEILQGAVQRVAHVQLTGDVGRRHDNGEGLLAFHAVRLKRAGGFPVAVNFAFHGLGIECFLHFHVNVLLYTIYS